MKQIIKSGILMGCLIMGSQTFAMSKAANRSNPFAAARVSSAIVNEAISLKTANGKAIAFAAGQANAITSVTPNDTASGQGQLILAAANGQTIVINLSAGKGIGIDAQDTPQIAAMNIAAADSGQGMAATLQQISRAVTAENDYSQQDSCTESIPQEHCVRIDYPHGDGRIGEIRCSEGSVAVIGSYIEVRATQDYNEIDELNIEDAAGRSALDIVFNFDGHRSDFHVSDATPCAIDTSGIARRVEIDCEDNTSAGCQGLPNRRAN